MQQSHFSHFLKRVGVCGLLCSLVIACNFLPLDGESEPLKDPDPPPVVKPTTPPISGVTPVPAVAEKSSDGTAGRDKWALWVAGTQLRGANIYQRRVYPELDGKEFMGPGPVGPPYTQEDFDNLAALGANYVNLSHPGLFAETAPYALDLDIQNNLDRLLEMAGKADLFAVISFRTGPGRAEFSLCCLEEAGDWFDESYLNDAVWRDADIQEAWTAMWGYMAERYGANPIVAGFDLMVEPNANEVLTGDWLDSDEFYDQYEGTLADWNQLYPRIIQAVRAVNNEIPILVGGMGYSGIDWLTYLAPVTDLRTVYVVHQYAPVSFTHQDESAEDCTYPGRCDTNWDGDDEVFDRDWLETRLSTIDDFVAAHNRPVAVNEFGAVRWTPGAAEFIADQISLLEDRGMNHALWVWDPEWGPWIEEVDAFNFRHGPDPRTHNDVGPSELRDVIVAGWGAEYGSSVYLVYAMMANQYAVEAEDVFRC